MWILGLKELRSVGKLPVYALSIRLCSYSLPSTVFDCSADSPLM